MAGFMAGFGTTLSNLIEEDRKYYRDSAAKRRDYIQTYGTRAVVERENQANAAMGTANYLISNGIPQEDVRYVLDTSGVQGIAQLKATLDSRDDLTKDEKAQLVKKAKDYVAKNPEEDLNTVVKRAYGLYQSESNPVKRERSMFSAMMGLDSRMMEDDVLDDMYINGMSGRDIYRIMGSAGPAAGAPIDLNLPVKAPSSQRLGLAANTLKDKFDYAIETKLNQAIANGDVKTREELEKIKERGIDGMADLAKKYPDLGLFEAAHSIELEQAGLITRNTVGLGGFVAEYKTWLGDKQDDETMTKAADDKKKDTTPTITTPTTTTTETYKFKTKEEFNTAASKGAIPPNAQVEIGDMPAQTFTAPKDYVYTPAKDIEPVVTTPTSPVAPGLDPALSPTRPGVDLKDGTVEQYRTYEGMYNALMSLPEDQRSDYVDSFALLEDVPSIAEAVNDLMEASPAIADSLGGYVYGGLGYGTSLVGEGLANAYAFITGDTAKAAKRRTMSRASREEAKKIMADGIVSHLQKLADDNNVSGAFSKERAAQVRQGVLNNKPFVDGVIDKLYEDGVLTKDETNPMVKMIESFVDGSEAPAPEEAPDYAAAAQRAPDHVVKLGDQVTKMWRDLSEAITGYQKVAQDARRAKNSVKPIFEKVANMSDEEKEARTQEIINYVEERKANQRAESERETIEAFDRQFIADWKNMPASVKTIVLGSKPKKQGMTEEETIRDLDRQFIKDWEGMPVQNKVIIRDVLYGKRVEEFTDEENKRLNEMREAHPEWFIDTLLDSLDVPTPSEVDTTFKSRTDFGPGIMSRMKPTEPKNVDLEGAPKIGDVEFENMLSRVHGGSSKIVEDFRKKITAGLKAADVTRLIKSTQGLPKTKSRDTLLVSLFDLRDALNKR